MSWHTTDVEGKKMYERSDGVRVSRTEDIEAIEQAEKREPSRFEPYYGNSFELEDDDMDFDDTPLGPVGMAVVIGVMALILIIIGFMSKGFPA